MLAPVLCFVYEVFVSYFVLEYQVVSILFGSSGTMHGGVQLAQQGSHTKGPFSLTPPPSTFVLRARARLQSLLSREGSIQKAGSPPPSFAPLGKHSIKSVEISVDETQQAILIMPNTLFERTQGIFSRRKGACFLFFSFLPRDSVRSTNTSAPRVPLLLQDHSSHLPFRSSCTFVPP